MKCRPVSWASVTGQDLFEFVTSGSRGWAQHYSESGPAFIRVGNLDHNSIKLDLRVVQHVNPPSGAEGERTRLRPDDLLISITADVGMVGVVPVDLGDAYINQHIALARPRPGVDGRFIAWYLASEADGKQKLRDVSRGGTKSGLGLDDIRQVEIPFPPRAEQTRIADKLDTVLARVDACRDRLARVSPLLKRFRQSVLAAATSGRLSEEWRGTPSTTENKISNALWAIPSEWNWCRADEIAGFITKGTTPSKESMSSGAGDVPYLKVYNLGFDGEVDFTIDPTFVSHSTHREDLKRSLVLPGDVLMNIVGPPLGKVAVVPDTFSEWNINQAIARFRPSQAVVSQYLCFCLMNTALISFAVRQAKATAGQFNLTLEICRALPIALPALEEQVEIVRRVESLFGFADRLENRLTQARSAAERLTPALLAKAFRGELVPQDPDDEPAAELLKRLAAERPSASNRKTRRSSSAVAAD